MTNMGLDIISVAFNKPLLITRQIELVREKVLDAHRLIVVDNSSSPDLAKQVRNACGREKVEYIRSPANFGRLSFSHGGCLNWAWTNVINPSQSQYFGFLDHDIFPFRKTTLIDKINRGGGMYGLVQSRPPIWYLWPGFCFFDKAIVEGLRGEQPLNFMPKADVFDTGGYNWEPLYSKAKMDDVKCSFGGYVKLADGNEMTSEKIGGDWLHMLNGSEWKPSPGKMELFFKYLFGLETASG